MSRRREQRESVLLRAVQEVLSRGLADPRIRGLLTVTEVRLTEDGKQAFISVSVLPGDKAELTMHGLRAATAHIRRDVMKRVRLREMPSLEFRLDGRVKRHAEVLGAINRASEATPPAVEPGSPAANDENGPAGDAGGDPSGGVDVEPQ